MRTILRNLGLGLTLTAVAAFGQTKPAFEVASVRIGTQPDATKMMAAMQGGGKAPIGVNVGPHRAEYQFMDLKSLIANAYGVKTYQVTGPDWLTTQRFDIVATLPDGASKDDAPKMLQALLEDRFKLAVHRTNAEHPVLALVAGKSTSSKMKPSTERPVAIDEAAPLQQGETLLNQGDGPMIMKMDAAAGGATINMGVNGKVVFKMNPATQAVHLDFSMVTMKGFADLLTQLFGQFGGAAGGRTVVDMSEIKGNYEVSLEISLMDMMNVARQGGDIGGGGPGGGGAPMVASDPAGGAATLTDAVQSLGMKLVSSKAMVEQLVVDHAEKTPTEN